MEQLDMLKLAIRAARAGGEVLARRWNTELEVSLKGAIDLVTDVDLEAEAAVLQALQSERPDDGYIAEEGGGRTGSTGIEWIIDPLDGTTNFSHGFPHFCVSVAARDRDGVFVGVVYEPLRDWVFAARRGHGSTLNDAPIQVSKTADLGSALVETGFPYDRRTSPQTNLPEFGRVLLRAQGGRRAGSAALALAYLSAGWTDGYWEFRLKPWDIAAGALLVSEAGGKLSALDGGPFILETGTILATNGRIHSALVARVEGAETL